MVWEYRRGYFLYNNFRANLFMSNVINTYTCRRYIDLQ